MDDKMTYDFMISGKEATVAEAIRYLKFLNALLAFDDHESYWHKPPKIGDSTMITTTSFSTIRRREVHAMISCLKELSKEANDLMVDFIEVSNIVPLGTTLIQIDRGRQRTMGHWSMPICNIKEALTLRKLASANPSATDFHAAAEAISRYLGHFDMNDGIAIGQVFADAIVSSCVKSRIRQRRGLMIEVLKSLKKVKNKIQIIGSSEFANGETVGYHKLLSFIDSLTLELDCPVSVPSPIPVGQHAGHMARI